MTRRSLSAALAAYLTPRNSKAVATHVSTALRKHYLRRHEATRIHRILSAGDFVSTWYAVGLRYVCRTGPALFSRECGLQTKSTALRTRRQHAAGGPFFDQLSAYCTVRFVLPDDQRTISDVSVARVRVVGRGLYCNGDTRGTSAGHERDPSLPNARFNSRCRRRRAWRWYCLSLEYSARKAASHIGGNQQILGPESRCIGFRN